MSVTPLRNTKSIREQVSEADWQARVELAAAYREEDLLALFLGPRPALATENRSPAPGSGQ